MQKIDVFGLTIIGLIIIAFFTTPSFFDGLSVITTFQIILMIIGLVVMSVTTLIKMSDRYVSQDITMITALLLFVVSSSIFIFNPEYLLTGLSLKMSFWHRVSFYTLPAIALETAIVTGFKVFVNSRNREKFTKIERPCIESLFYTYTLSTMLINFLALFLIVSVHTHLMATRFIIVSVTILVILFARRVRSF